MGVVTRGRFRLSPSRMRTPTVPELTIIHRVTVNDMKQPWWCSSLTASQLRLLEQRKEPERRRTQEDQMELS